MYQNPYGIIAADYYLPGTPVDVRDWAPLLGVAPELVQALISNGCRYFHMGEGESDLSLSMAAFERLLKRAGIAAREVDYLIHANTQPFSIPEPPRSVVAELAAAFDLQPKLAFGITHLGCASVFAAIEAACALLQSDPDAHYVAIVTADRVFDEPFRLRKDQGIQSDGSSALLIGRGEGLGRLASLCLRYFPKLDGGPASPQFEALHGTFNWAYTKTATAEALQQARLTMRDIGIFLPTNSEAPLWLSLGRSLGAEDHQMFTENTRRRGHACCANLAINLVDAGFEHLAAGHPVLAAAQSNNGAYAAFTLLPPGATAEGR
ncbi:ketoacyl-ACP synthase III family protein [Parachitinimonas caeni]|uniref:Ketoacyl-ACP synthase III family protein n=1 Tax=Parachitinimonas caeni TaxID=3031301 RepID=A0ABT7E4U0_9NEIS|nr:ketoacyl-ACP synthase III family protein [Parachitinimonas caeni]MDK2125937.1 ketoacyl-ACP synthase III family protein [Parachitinimonas caeni]